MRKNRPSKIFVKNGPLNKARQLLIDLEASNAVSGNAHISGISADAISCEFELATRHAHVPLRELDFYGNNTNEQIQTRINKVLETPYLLEARARLVELENPDLKWGSPEIGSLVYLIDSSLNKAGKTFADLDATGQSSNEQMEARIKQAAKNRHLEWAQSEWAKFEEKAVEPRPSNDSVVVDCEFANIFHSLESSEESIQALDATGQSSGSQMVGRLVAAYVIRSLATEYPTSDWAGSRNRPLEQSQPTM